MAGAMAQNCLLLLVFTNNLHSVGSPQQSLNKREVRALGASGAVLSLPASEPLSEDRS